MVRGESALRGRSRCPLCRHPLGAGDLFPVFHYLMAKGRCRYCKGKIPVRYFWSEVTLAGVFAGLFLRYGWTGETLWFMGFSSILLGISLADWDCCEIPPGFLWTAGIWWGALLPLLAQGVWLAAARGLAGACALGGGVLAITLVLDYLLGKESMGGGDIKLYAVAGLYLGPGKGLLMLIVSCLLGLGCCIWKQRSRIPLGPWISLACILTFFMGDPAVNWYLSLFPWEVPWAGFLF